MTEAELNIRQLEIEQKAAIIEQEMARIAQSDSLLKEQIAYRESQENRLLWDKEVYLADSAYRAERLLYDKQRLTLDRTNLIFEIKRMELQYGVELGITVPELPQ